MLNQVSKLKGNEIFSFVTPDGTDKVIVTKDLIGNILNVIDDINNKKEQAKPPVPPVIKDDCADVRKYAKEAVIKSNMATLNSTEAIKMAKTACGDIRKALGIACEAKEAAGKAEFLVDKVNLVENTLDRVQAQVNINIATIVELQEAIQDLQDQINQLTDIINGNP